MWETRENNVHTFTPTKGPSLICFNTRANISGFFSSLTSWVRSFVRVFCTSHYSGSRSVTRSYSEPSSRCGHSCCIPGTLNESFFSWMKNPSENLLENSASTALGTFAALFIKSLKLYRFCTWKANLLVISIYETFAAHNIVFLESSFTLTCGPGIPCWPGGPGSPWGPYHAKKNSRALGLHFCTTDLHCQD